MFGVRCSGFGLSSSNISLPRGGGVMVGESVMDTRRCFTDVACANRTNRYTGSWLAKYQGHQTNVQSIKGTRRMFTDVACANRTNRSTGSWLAKPQTPSRLSLSPTMKLSGLCKPPSNMQKLRLLRPRSRQVPSRVIRTPFLELLPRFS